MNRGTKPSSIFKDDKFSHSIRSESFSVKHKKLALCLGQNHWGEARESLIWQTNKEFQVAA